ncbi:hypothetical protein F4678DRAFT_485335 [Xylaria arbuscula]|nr:hypothetical protein F4678DRAFT_485335 [Xylaria arbuscula]
MEAWGADAFYVVSDRMRQLALFGPKWTQIKLHAINEALHNGLPAILPQNQYQLFDFDFWLDLQRQAEKKCDIPPPDTRKPARRVHFKETVSSGRVATKSSRDQACPAQAASKQSRKEITRQATAANTADTKEDEDSDAISDTSFTPPKNLGRFAQLDKDGRRHVVLPTKVTNRAPKQQRRTQKPTQGRRQILPPPGFHSAAPNYARRLALRPAKLTFERKLDFEVKCGGVSLIALEVEAMRASRGDEKNTKKEKKSRPAANRHSDVQRVSSNKQPRARDEDVSAHWESGFLKGVFEAENDLLYDSRWPASTF